MVPTAFYCPIYFGTFDAGPDGEHHAFSGAPAVVHAD